MANEVVQYDNRLNAVSFGSFNENELDFFMAICSKVKNKTTETLEFTFKEIEELANYKVANLTRFHQDLKQTNSKLLQLNFTHENSDIYVQFVLFNTFKVDKKNQTITISVNRDFAYLLNEFSNQWTKFELLEFTQISGVYAKLLYKTLKQWKTTGRWGVQIDEFRRLFDVPKWYRMSEIDRRIINPSIKELQKIKDFENLKVTKIKKGRRIDKLVFDFTKWDKKKNDFFKQTKGKKVVLEEEYTPEREIELSKQELYEQLKLFYPDEKGSR